MRYAPLIAGALALIACNRDPKYLTQKYLQTGNKYFDAGRYKEASIMYRKSIGVDRKFGPAYYKLALADFKTNTYADALPALRRAVELLPPGTPDANDASLRLAEILVVGARTQPKNDALIGEIQGFADGFAKRNPNSWEAYYLNADLAIIDSGNLYRANKPDEGKAKLTDAIAKYRKALAAIPVSSDSRATIVLSLARSLDLAGESDEAESLLKALEEKDKHNINAWYELYGLYIAHHKNDQAEALLKTAIQNNPKDPTLRLSLAQYYFASNKRNDLIALLDQMKGDLKQFPDAYIQSGDFFLRAGAWDEAGRQYEEGIQKDPKRKNVYLAHEVELYTLEKKPDMARDKNEQILKADPKDADARARKATFQLNSGGDVNQALSELQAAATARPNNYVIRFNLGRAHLARHEYEEARQEFEAAIALRPDYIPARLAQIQVTLLRGDYDAALNYSDQLLKIAPGSLEGMIVKSISLSRLRRFDEARSLLNQILQKQPRQPDALVELGAIDMAEHKLRDAEDRFHQAYEAEPNNLRGLMGEARAYFAEGKGEKAVQLLQAEAAKNPLRLDIAFELGDVQNLDGQLDQAIATWQRVLGGKPNKAQQAELYFRIGQASLAKHDWQQSVNNFEKALEEQPNDPGITDNLAALYQAQKKADTARKYYEMSLKQDPNDGIALNNLAYLMADGNGNLDQALAYATRAKQRLPKNSEVSDTLGWIYIKKSLTDNAVATFRDLIAQVPQNPTYHYHYAIALQQKGDLVNARKECQTALADKPDNDLSNQIHQLLTKIG